MTFHSILLESTEVSITEEPLEVPAFFTDLNLDQIIKAITAGKQEYHLLPFFYAPLKTIDAILYRHDIMRDLEQQRLFEQIQAFAQKLRAMRDLCWLLSLSGGHFITCGR